MPRIANSSSVRGSTVSAFECGSRSARFSSTTTSIPAVFNSAANQQPTGPPPATTTSHSNTPALSSPRNLSGAAERSEASRPAARSLGSKRLVELVESRAGALIGGRERDNACTEALSEPQVRIVERQQAYRRMSRALRLALHSVHVVPIPEGRELWRGPVETRDEYLPGGLVEVLGHRSAVLRDHALDDL